MNILHPLGSSDHNMLSFTVHIDCEVSHAEREIRDYTKGNYDQIKSLLADVVWDTVMSGAVNDSCITIQRYTTKTEGCVCKTQS